MNKSSQKIKSKISSRKRKDKSDEKDDLNDINNGGCVDKTQWNEHWNDWISRCNQFSSCLNKTKEHLYGYQFNRITKQFEIVKKNAVSRTLKQTNSSITEIQHLLDEYRSDGGVGVDKYRKLNKNVTEFRRQLLKMKRTVSH